MSKDLVAGGLIPTTIEEALKLSEIFSKSQIVPKNMIGKPNDIFSAIACGLEIGLSPMQSLQSVAVINGRTTIWGDIALALVRGSGKLEYIHETQTEDMATCRIKRVNEEEITVTFSKADAERAGLWDNRKTITTQDSRTIPNPSTWYCYPKRMMQMRARSFALRDKFTDVLKGVAIAEEVQDFKENVEIPVEATSKAPEADIDVKGALLEEDVVEAVIEEEMVTEKTIMTYFNEHKGTPKGDAIKTEMMKDKKWREYSQEKLSELYKKLQDIDVSA